MNLFRRLRRQRQLRSQGWFPPGVPAVIFSHIPKCGGTTVLHWISENLPMWTYRSQSQIPKKAPPEGDFVLYAGHLPISALVNDGLYTRDQIDNVFSFTFVREPLSRVTSLFHQHVSSGKQKVATDIDSFIEQLWERRDDPSWGTPALRLMAKPSSFWAHPVGGPPIRQIYKLEEFDQALLDLSARLDIPPKSKRMNLSRVVDGEKQVPSKKSVDLVTEIYADDYRNFGYSEPR